MSPAAFPEPPLPGLLAPAALLPCAEEGRLPPEAGRPPLAWADAAATALDPLAASPLAGLAAGFGLLAVPAVVPEPCFCAFLAGARKSSSSKESSSDSSYFTACTRCHAGHAVEICLTDMDGGKHQDLLIGLPRTL